MEYKKYYKSAFPREMKIRERDKSLLCRFNRVIAIKQSYVLFHLGVTANLLSVIRIILALTGIVLLHLSDNVLYMLLGFLLIVWQVNLDFADGCLARVRNTKDPYGTIIDGLANEFVRVCMILISSFLIGSIYIFLVSIVVLYSTQIVHFRIKSENDNYLKDHKSLSNLFRLINGVLFSNIFLPFILLLNRISMSDATYYYYSVLSVYLIAAIPLYIYLVKDHKL